MTFTSPFASGTNVIVTLTVRDRAGSRLMGDDCFPAVANTSVAGFTLQWRNLDGAVCTVSGNGSVTVNYMAVGAQ